MKIIEYKIDIKNKVNVIINIFMIKADFKLIHNRFLLKTSLREHNSIKYVQ